MPVMQVQPGAGAWHEGWARAWPAYEGGRAWGHDVRNGQAYGLHMRMAGCQGRAWHAGWGKQSDGGGSSPMVGEAVRWQGKDRKSVV